MKWKTMNGQILSFQEMSDSHLENSIKYIYKNNPNEPWSWDKKSQDGLAYLLEERTKRIRKRFLESTMKCQFCGSDMFIKDVSPIDVGFIWPQYAYVCSNCPARSGEIKMPEKLT